jgi:D-alanine-D-alanine ligase
VLCSQEFVDGREFTVLVAENPDDPRNPIAFVPVEVAFPAGETFKHFDLKVSFFQC